MGLLSSLFGGQKRGKNDLIRDLAKMRVRDDPMAAAMGLTESSIDELGVLQLAGLPESTIATVVETYAKLKQHGASDDEIFVRIERHRSAIGSGTMPTPLTLRSYIGYRFDLEHGPGAPIAADLVERDVRMSSEHFGG